MSPVLPAVRGPITDALFSRWTDGSTIEPVALGRLDPLRDDDLHLALWSCYELHYRGFADVDDALEWDGPTLALRAQLEGAFEGALRAEHAASPLPPDPVTALRIVSQWAGPPLAATIESGGTLDRIREFATHRSSYQLKEADPHTWALPRLAGPGRSAMLQIQMDEYGRGEPGQAHAEIFAAAMAELGLCPDFGHYVEQLPGVTLATDNLVSMFGLHRRLRGALVGHLALFEMCSVVPMTRYLNAARRVGGLPALERFYEVHVEADAHHAVLALDQMVQGIVATEPDLASDVAFGATALSRVESRFARHVLQRWDEGASSLLTADPDAAEDHAPLVAVS